MKLILFVSLLLANFLDATFTSILVLRYGAEAEANPIVYQMILWFGVLGIWIFKTPFLAIFAYLYKYISNKVFLILNIVYWPVIIYSAFLL